jgi:hypothetical protein
MDRGKQKRIGYIAHMKYNALPKSEKYPIKEFLKKKDEHFVDGWNQCSDTHVMGDKMPNGARKRTKKAN